MIFIRVLRTARAVLCPSLNVVFAGIFFAHPVFALDESPTGTLLADANDGAITYTIINDNGNFIADVEVTGATTGNGIYQDILTINSTAASSPGVIAVAVAGNTDWTVSALNNGVVNIAGLSTVSFSGIADIGGSVGDDIFTLLAPITGSMDGGPGNDEIVGIGVDNIFAINVADGGAWNDASFANIENLTGGAGADTFTFSAALSGTARGGAGDDEFTLDPGGSAGLLDGGAGSDVLAGLATANIFVVNATDGGTLNGQAFANFEDLTGGAANDTFTLTAALTGTARGNAGDDTFNFNDGASVGFANGGVDNDTASFAGFSAPVTIDLADFGGVESFIGSGFDDVIALNGNQNNDISVDGGSGSDIFNVLSSSQIAGDLAVSNIEEASFGADVSASNIILNIGGVISQVGAIVAGSDITISGVGGEVDLDLQFGSDGTGGTLTPSWSGATEPVAIAATGGAGADTLIGFNADTTWDISGTNTGAASSDIGVVSFTGVENLAGGSGADTFQLNGGTAALIDGGAGVDAIIGSSGPDSFVVNALDAGTVNLIEFANIENLSGSGDADTFVLNAGLSGVLDGGAGLDTIIGAAGPNSFVVDALDAGTANLVGFSQIENLTGGGDSDSFVFSAELSGVADGGGGNDVFRLSPNLFVTVDGGAGSDELVINGPNTTDLGVTSVEQITFIPEEQAFKVQGTVNFVSDDLLTDFSVGENFKLVYTFDTGAVDTDPAIDLGFYDAVLGAEVEVGDYIADLSPSGLNRINVQNDYLTGRDRYRVDLSGVSGPTAAGLPLGDQFPILLLTDFTGVALSDDSLPMLPLDLNDFGQNDFLSLRFIKPDETTAVVTATLDSFEVIPAFRDVPPSFWAAAFISTLAENRITSGCGLANFCPNDEVTRAQMAVFLERGMRGGDYVPPAASGNVFFDVAANDFAAAFIEQLASDGITSGCGNGNYCPGDNVTRAQMAVFLLRAKYGQGYLPPPPQGVFGDVDTGYWAAAWIEQLFAEGITSGCGNGNYCPNAPATRAQMAVFLVRTFEL